MQLKSKVSRVIRTLFSYTFEISAEYPTTLQAGLHQEFIYPATFYFQSAIPVMGTWRKTQKGEQIYPHIRTVLKASDYYSVNGQGNILTWLIPETSISNNSSRDVQRDRHFLWVQTLNFFQILAISIISFQNTSGILLLYSLVIHKKSMENSHFKYFLSRPWGWQCTLHLFYFKKTKEKNQYCYIPCRYHHYIFNHISF